MASGDDPNKKDNSLIFPFEESISRRDLEIILEVNKKAIQIHTEVIGQNEEIMERLDEQNEHNNNVHNGVRMALDEYNKKVRETLEDSNKHMHNAINDIESKVDRMLIKQEESGKEIFKTQLLFVVGILGIIAQFIQMLWRK
jgi:hypothetical protein